MHRNVKIVVVVGKAHAMRPLVTARAVDNRLSAMGLRGPDTQPAVANGHDDGAPVSRQAQRASDVSSRRDRSR
jgi:hypothetical protein